MTRFKKVLIIDNFDSFTFNLVDYFRQCNCEVEVHRNNVDPKIVEKVDPELIVFSPGPNIPKNAGNMMDIIDQYHQQYPMFGVCLGHEAFIEYFGGTLKLVAPVHGKSTEIDHDGMTIFSDCDPKFLGGRYHSLAGDHIPDCFHITATSTGEPLPTHEEIVMAIRHKDLPIESVQFHPESILTMKGENGFRIIENVVHKKFANL